MNRKTISFKNEGFDIMKVSIDNWPLYCEFVKRLNIVECSDLYDFFNFAKDAVTPLESIDDFEIDLEIQKRKIIFEKWKREIDYDIARRGLTERDLVYGFAIDENCVEYFEPQRETIRNEIDITEDLMRECEFYEEIERDENKKKHCQLQKYNILGEWRCVLEHFQELYTVCNCVDEDLVLKNLLADCELRMLKYLVEYEEKLAKEWVSIFVIGIKELYFKSLLKFCAYKYPRCDYKTN